MAMTLNEYCTGIADAIRTKEGSTEKIPAPDHKARILAIQTGVTLPELTNPAAEEQVLNGYEFIDGDGAKKTGTYVASSGGVSGIEVTMTVQQGYIKYIDETGTWQSLVYDGTEIVLTTKVVGGVVLAYSSDGCSVTGDYTAFEHYGSGSMPTTIFLFNSDGGTVTANN